MSFAGRLDPMARGLMIVLKGDAMKRQKEVETVSKVYQFQMLMGFSTDTFDILGMENSSSNFRDLQPNSIPSSDSSTDQDKSHIDGKIERSEAFDIEKQERIVEMVRLEAKKMIERFEQPYPPYSSARVDGRPLHEWARLGKLSEIKIPTAMVEIFSLEVLKSERQSPTQIYESMRKRIGRLKSGKDKEEKVSLALMKKRKRGQGESHNDFRQEEILKRWKSILINDSEERNEKKEEEIEEEKNLLIITMEAKVSSGTFIRSITDRIGKNLGCGAIAFDIYRTQVESYNIDSAINLDNFKDKN
eukprot:TRINITY_DN6469_c0_g1_i1.p1 TRINITY_DN6469_c0_g1~~TRINITY_DN6469_c0_g1_i1.p1  ORF type:complete len:349 (-),score=136.62 TRINITY_DN6469_c0_g1_i1:211-1119(-)